MRWINRLGAAMLLLVVVAGPPLAAALWVADHPLTWPTADRLQTWLAEPLTATTIIAGCTGVAVIGWLLLVYLLTREAVRAVRLRWRRRHLRLPSPAQITASSMAGVAALTLPGLNAGDHHRPPAADAAAEQPVLHGPPRDQNTQAVPGIDLPGGSWLPTSTALAATVAASLIWVRRRQHYQPRPPHPDRTTRDQDLQPLPATVDAITAALPAGHEPADHADAPAVSINQLPDGVICLDGPGAAHAARGMIVTAALAVATGHPGRQLGLNRVDLATLLPGTDPGDLTLAGVHHDGPPPDQPEQPAAQPDKQPAASRAPAEPRTTIRLAAEPAATVRWHVTRGGVITGTGITTPQRLCVLDRHAATDLLALVRQVLRPAGASGQPRTDAPTAPSPAAAQRLASPAPARLTLIGGCELTAAATPVHLRRKAGLQILAYLAVHPGGVIKNDLIRACWPGELPAAIRQRLHTTISDLRRQLHPLIGADPITRTGERYTLNHRAVDTDLHEWHKTLHSATHETNSEVRLRAVRTLIDRYRGDLAAGHDWPWITPARESLRRDVIDAYIAAAEAQPAEATRLLLKALTIDPHNHELRRRAGVPPD